jgi:hypothetical protein
MGGWMGGCKSRFKDCLQQSKIIYICGLSIVREILLKDIIEQCKLREKV